MLLFYYLMIGHAIADFPLQGDAMSIEKSRHSKSPLQKAVPWYYWLTAHALIHAGFVTMITGSAFLGLIELVLHWCIDYAKCEKWTNIHHDQALHMICKAVWVILITQGIIPSNPMIVFPLPGWNAPVIQ